MEISLHDEILIMEGLYHNRVYQPMPIMIAITADEKKIIHELYPDVHIVRTMKQDSKRHHPR